MSVQMGGYGSGRPSSGRPTTDSLLFLDIRYMRRAGFFQLTPGTTYQGSLEWSYRGKPSGNISVIVQGTEAAYPPEIVLDYSVKTQSETTWTPVRERITIETTECHYGGERPWFLCPQCFSRRAVLFSVDGRFRCRECHDIVYSSTRETADDRVFRRALALQKRLGGHKHGTVFDPESKPSNMHWSTYGRICNELDDLARESYASLLVRFGNFEKSLKEASLIDLARTL
jgi:hypothetical protein